MNGSILHGLEGKAKSQAQYFHVVCLHSLSIYPSYLDVNVLFSKRNQANTSLLCGLKNIKVMYLCHAFKVLDCWCMNPESGVDHQDSSTQCFSRLCWNSWNDKQKIETILRFTGFLGRLQGISCFYSTL